MLLDVKDVSPIECAMINALGEYMDAIAWPWWFSDSPVFKAARHRSTGRLVMLPPWRGPTAGVCVIQQAKVEAMRDDGSVASFFVDILLLTLLDDDRIAALAIECDGRDWHERTIGQAIHDRRRDALLLTAGLPTVRYMGTEIHHDSQGCARQAIDLLLSLDGRGVGVLDALEGY